jgi:1-acyl-sn-glycerol-3-phosphate acyltransferase
MILCSEHIAVESARRVIYSLRPIAWRRYFHLKVDGLANIPETGPFILCANHASHLDALAILAALPPDVALRARTAAAADVWGSPLRREVAELATNCITLERGSSFAGGLRELETVLKGGAPLILFPEGRRSPDGAMVEFKEGAAMLAYRADCPTVPVYLSGLFEALPRKTHLPKRTTVRVKFGTPIRPGAYRLPVQAGWIDKRQAYEQLTLDLRQAITRLSGRKTPKRGEKIA